ncbi:hypothetical protein BU196_00440 [Streptomyces sp. CBMA370]|nr:hypothetical protein [Streptomyces sp. CBMA370]
MDRKLTADAAPALGDVRQMGHGDTLWLAQGVRTRPDWSRYTDAIGGAVARGADARWVRG